MLAGPFLVDIEAQTVLSSEACPGGGRRSPPAHVVRQTSHPRVRPRRHNRRSIPWMKWERELRDTQGHGTGRARWTRRRFDPRGEGLRRSVPLVTWVLSRRRCATKTQPAKTSDVHGDGLRLQFYFTFMNTNGEGERKSNA